MADMRTIEIDFDVHKRIELDRRSFSETDNDVLRRLLGIECSLPVRTVELGGRAWSSKGVELPHGTELRMQYNGQVYTGVIQNGKWMVEGGQYKSPSAAAGGVARTKNGNRTSLDGWIYWQVKLPGKPDWTHISDLRPERETAAAPEHKSEKKPEDRGMTTLTSSGPDLPTENCVIAELEDYLIKQARPVTPSEAYRTLAEKLGLTQEQRNRMMHDSDENHWENRVRQARRKLVNAGRLDVDQPRGWWALRKQTTSKA